MEDYEKRYAEFWQPIIENPDGSINKEQLKKELYDFSTLISNASKVYLHITGDVVGKVETPAAVIIEIADNNYKNLLTKPLSPHPDFDFVDHDKVFVENADGSMDYFELYYEAELAAWVLVPYTDKHFSSPKKVNGKTKVENLSAYGYDLLERVDEYDLEELK